MLALSLCCPGIVNMRTTVFVVVFFCLTISHSIADNQVTVTVKSGPIVGFKQLVADRWLNIFLGIPYAKPPVGDLRFRRPQPNNDRWSDPLIADRYPNPCQQMVIPKVVTDFGSYNVSEDCLYLNIWSPDVETDQLKPVFLWIHGGALAIGSNGQKGYDPSGLVAIGDVVAVSINYRLNFFGFLYSGTDEAPGNVGFWDQALAIEWVKDNIRYFGGDPDQITLYGQSAGSWSVGIHFVSPVTRNLFKNGIMLSAAPVGDFPVADPQVIKQNSLTLAQLTDCAEEESEMTDDVVNCLRTLDADVLLEKSTPLIWPNMTWMVYGDRFLPQRPEDMIQGGDFKKNSQLLMGFTQDEGGFMLRRVDPKLFYSKDNPPDVDKTMAYEYLKLAQSKNFISQSVTVDEVMKVYLSTIPDSDHHQIRAVLSVLLGDYIITCPTRHYGALVVESDPDTQVYQYLWNVKFNRSIDEVFMVNQLCADWLGSCHGHDLPATFGRPFHRPDKYSDWHRQLAGLMIETMVHFNKHGRPAPIDDVEWPGFYKIKGRLVKPVYEFGESSRESGFRNDYKSTECDVLWRDLVK